ncbi:MAG: glycosyltransferase [Bacteroidetes Order II. Incertae sedis bacterium]|jgi:glycosyltransferase involved in cell wall biosynthesis|nr:glycosyltransferase [Bacteroidetes Order II. bacterium]MBT6201318.1 glycosyltransferase [Bacteroidetes Order II. bacterium]MBT6425322.1 glycosyltransferase [Bacteroidetes Order II. bacterium]MBT6580231.1 glycosyltransferase [Bacteroidetes Order II. bacterium]MBT6599723.1 glycosyltransferase [Bacteroidetes Order II. bacterium]
MGSEQKHVLIVAYYFPPMGLSGVQRIAKMAKYLPEAGYRVTVLTVEPGSYFAFDDSLLAELESVEGIHIVRTRSLDPTRLHGGYRGKGHEGHREAHREVPFPEEKSRKVLSTISQFLLLPDNKIGWRKYAVATGLRILKETPADVILATAPPYTSFLIGRDLSLRTHTPLAIDYRDDWVDNPRHSYPTALHRRITASMERKVVNQTSVVIAINKTILDLIKKRQAGPNPTYTVVPQGFDPEDFANVSTQTSESDQLVFLYTGMFYDAQQPDAFLKGIRILLDRRPELTSIVRCKFAGIFPERGKEIIQQLKLEPVVDLLGYLSHTDTVQQLVDCSVAWMTIGRQQGEEMISTGKLFDYMGSLKPILALVPDGEAKNALSSYGAAFTCPPDEAEHIADELESIVGLWQAGTLPKGSRENIQIYDRRKQARILSNIFDKISG